MTRDKHPRTVAGLRSRARSESLLLRAELPDYPRPGWHTATPCKGLPPDVFFDIHTPRVCITCPVRIDCLAAAMAEEAGEVEVYGHRAIPAEHRDRWRRARRRGEQPALVLMSERKAS